MDICTLKNVSQTKKADIMAEDAVVETKINKIGENNSPIEKSKKVEGDINEQTRCTELPIDDKKKNHECHICDSRLASAWKLKRHIASVHGGKKSFEYVTYAMLSLPVI